MSIHHETFVFTKAGVICLDVSVMNKGEMCYAWKKLAILKGWLGYRSKVFYFFIYIFFLYQFFFFYEAAQHCSHVACISLRGEGVDDDKHFTATSCVLRRKLPSYSHYSKDKVYTIKTQSFSEAEACPQGAELQIVAF
jgi:hypothetical protein